MLILHVLLLVIVTIQVSIYANDKFEVTSFVAENHERFGEHFIISDSNDQPVKHLHKFSDVYNQITRVVESFYTISEESVNPFNYFHGGCSTRHAHNLTMMIEYVKYEDYGKNMSCFFPNRSDNFIYHRDLFMVTAEESGLDDRHCTNCTNETECCSIETCDCTVRNQVEYFINRDNSYRLQQMKFSFTLNALYQTGIVERDSAINAVYHVDITMKNKLQHGHVEVDLKIDPKLERYHKSTLRRGTILDVFVLVFAMIISKLYIISVLKLIRLLKDVKLHFLAYHKKQVSWSDLSALVNTWHLMTLFACLLIKASTVMKIIGDYKETISFHLIEAVSIILGSGMFLLWCGLFGFLKYFESLNVLLITVKLALPSILRFAVCVLILFMAFIFCGWLVMGPYNPQFKNPLTTAENLLSFLNGEGIDVAFAKVSWDDPFVSVAVAIFNKIYLLLFTFVFIYIVLSLFIGIFDHAYDSLSDNWKKRSRGFVQDWAEGEPDDDLTKNYPFPVPRIREILNEFDSFKHGDESDRNIVTPSPTDQNSIVSQNNEDTNSNVIVLNGSANVNKNCSSHTLSPFSSVSLPANVPFQARVFQPTQRRVHSQRDHHTKCKYCGLRLAQSKSNSNIKSTVRKPFNASQRDVARARSIIRNSMLSEELLEEGDI
ncbi:mucolipin-3-like [Dysidea avara]|uniref:mucolipin-3-like n=1 Tax=Dysidea avara TaxID=196820 RepID=UPI00331DCBE7